MKNIKIKESIIYIFFTFINTEALINKTGINKIIFYQNYIPFSGVRYLENKYTEKYYDFSNHKKCEFYLNNIPEKIHTNSLNEYSFNIFGFNKNEEIIAVMKINNSIANNFHIERFGTIRGNGIGSSFFYNTAKILFNKNKNGISFSGIAADDRISEILGEEFKDSSSIGFWKKIGFKNEKKVYPGAVTTYSIFYNDIRLNLNNKNFEEWKNKIPNVNRDNPEIEFNDLFKRK